MVPVPWASISSMVAGSTPAWSYAIFRALVCPSALGEYMLCDFPSLEDPMPFITAYILLPSLSASSSRLRTNSPIPSPSTVPSASFEKGRASPVGERTRVLEKHMCMKMSLSISTPPVITISLFLEMSSITARWTAPMELAQAASTTQFVPPRSRRLHILPATTFPKSPGNEFSCHDTYESDIF